MINNQNSHLSDPNGVDIPVIKSDGEYAYYNKVNLIAIGIEPLQVLRGVTSDLVKDKTTDFNITYYSSLDDTVEAEILVEAPDFSPSSYEFRHSFLPGTNSFVIGSQHLESPLFFPLHKPAANYRFTIDPENSIPESDKTDNVFPRTGFKSSEVEATRSLRILFVAVRFTGEDGYPGYFNGFARADFEEHAAESVKYIKATYPLAESEIKYYVACFNAPVDAGSRPTNSFLANFQMLSLIVKLALRAGNNYDRVVGVVRSDWFDTIPGWAGTLGFSWPLSPKGVVVSLGYWKTTAHEIGHTYGLGHNNDNGAGYYVIGRRSVDSQTFMSTGAIQNPPAQFGYQRPVPSFWVRSEEYQRLLAALRELSDPETLLISGTFWLNGTLRLDCWYSFSSGTPDFDEGGVGNCSVAQFDSSGNLLSTVGFNASFTDELHGRSFDMMPFAFMVPYAQGASVIKILNATGSAIASRTASNHAPNVHLIYPSGGEILGSDNLQVSWEASDEDGDTLTYSLLVSADGGISWNPVENGLIQTAYNLTLTGFSGGNEYLLRVIASDGLNTGEDTSGAFTIASFTIDSITASQIVPPGSEANYTFLLTSYGGFSGSIDLNATSSTTNKLIFSWINGSTIILMPDEQRTVVLQVGVTNTTERGNHTLVVSGRSGVNTEVALAYVFADAQSDETPPVTSDNYDGAWHTVDFPITLTSVDNISGVAATYYEINNGPAKTVNVDGNPWITTEGANNTLEYWSIDNAGNQEAHHFLTGVKLDKTPPETSIILTGTLGNNNWFLSNVTVTLDTTDIVSGVRNREYSFDNVTWIPYTTLFNIGKEGYAIVYYRSTDEAGNIEALGNRTIKIDKTPPTGSILINGDSTYANSTSAALLVSANDGVSGVSEMRFSNDNVTWTMWETYGVSKAWTMTTEEGTKTVFCQFMDNAGLSSGVYVDSIILDTAAPIIQIPSRVPEGDVQPDQAVTIFVNASDLLSGVKSVRLTYTLGASWVDTLMTLNSSTNLYEYSIPGQAAGTPVKYKITAHDYAGNNMTDDNAGQYYVYTVIPELPSLVALELFMMATLLAVVIYRRRVRPCKKRA
jgi:hypothetical protein